MNESIGSQGISWQNQWGPWLLAFLVFPVSLNTAVSGFDHSNAYELVMGSIAVFVSLWSSEIWYRQNKRYIQ